MKSFFLILIFCPIINVSAQVQVFLHQPPPGQLNIADLWKFEVINNTENDRYIKFYATVNSEDGVPLFEGTSSVYELSSMFSGVVSFPELEPFDMAHVDEEIKEILLRTGTVPSGVYVICLEIIDAESAESIFRDCIDQEVFQASPPILIYPMDGSALEEEMPVFSWMEPVPPIDGMLYKIRISEILTDQSPEQALLSTPPYFEYGGIMGNMFEFPLSARPLEVGKSYVWRVTGTILGRDLLESEYSTFMRLDPTGMAANIELTFPPDGGLIDPKKNVFCWKPIPGDGIVYNVIVSKQECDTTPTTDESHPYGYLGADPDAQRADSLRMAIDSIDIPYWRAVCEKLRENIETARLNRRILSDQQRQFEEWAREIKCELTEPECNLPDCCPGGDCCAGLDPSSPADRAEFRRRIACLTNPMKSMKDAVDDFADDFEWLIDRWESGAEHRNTMGAYDDIFGALEYLMSLEWIEDLKQEVFDALGVTQMMKEVRDFVLTQVCIGLQYSDADCQGFIAKLNELEQLLNDVKEGKEDVELAIDAFKALRSGGELPIDIFLKLMENLYAAAGEATGTAVVGWENFWKEMCQTLQRAYRINICMQELNEQIAQLEKDCPEFCTEVLAQLEEESNRAAAELARLKEERHNRWLADSTAFNNDLDDAIAEFTNNLSRSNICCQDQGSGNVVYTFPPYGSGDPCKDYLFGLLSQQLGDRLCYFNIRVEINCETLEVNYIWKTTKNFRRNEDCCPRVPEEETVGRTEGNPGEDEVCWPTGGGESGAGREGIDTEGEARWRVEAERDGIVVGRSSSRRYRTRPGYADPPTPDTIKIPRDPGTGCDCQVKISINGFALPPGVGMLVEPGTSLNIKMMGGCSGSCVSKGQKISIQLPVLRFLGMNWINPGINAGGPLVNYQFVDQGIHKVVATQECSDGSKCEASAVIEVIKKKSPAGADKLVSVIDVTANKCGNSSCIHPYYYSDQNRLLIPRNEIVFKKPGVYKIGYLTDCFPQCSVERDVTWQITGPDGTNEVKSGQDLFEIGEDFKVSGIYSICIIESAKCSNGDLQDSKFLVVKIE